MLRICLDPFHETDPGSKKTAEILQNFQKKVTRILFFPKIFNFWLTDINIYLINNKTNNFLEKYISDRKKVGIFSILGRIRIHIKMERIRNTGLYND